MGDLCPCVSLTCKCVNASIGNVEHWMCGESWLAIKDLQPTIPSSQGWASSVLFNPFAGARNNCAHTPGAGIFVVTVSQGGAQLRALCVRSKVYSSPTACAGMWQIDAAAA